MRTMALLDDLRYREDAPNAQPLYVDANGRVLRFTLKPGQRIAEHQAAHSPFYVVVLKGRAVFTGGDGAEREVGPNTLLVLDPGEKHSVRALDDEVVFVGFLHGVPGTRADKTGGRLSRA